MLHSLYSMALTYIVGTYSPGNEFVVYEISIQVFPTEPSPTTTHFISLSAFAIAVRENTQKTDYQTLIRAHHNIKMLTIHKWLYNYIVELKRHLL